MVKQKYDISRLEKSTKEFKGNRLMNIPRNIPRYNFLVGDFGKEILNEYNSILKQNYKENPYPKILDFRDGVVEGSNLYSIFLMNDILSKQGLRTATPSDVQKIINSDKNFLKGHYVTLSLILRTERHQRARNPKIDYLSEQLGKQAKDRNYNFSDSSPLIFKSSDLKLIVDNNSKDGLGFKIKDSATPFNAPELSYENDNKKFKFTNKNGVPIFNKSGNRRYAAAESEGLSELYLDGDSSDLGSGDWYFLSSSSYGRIVILNNA